MKTRLCTIGLVTLFAAASTALAQAPAGPPKPGPELKRLGYFEGKWTAEGEQKANPFGPAGKFTSKDTCEWILDGFFLRCVSEGKDPPGDVKGLGLMGTMPKTRSTRTTASTAGAWAFPGRAPSRARPGPSAPWR